MFFKPRLPTSESFTMKLLLMVVGLSFMAVLVVLPLVAVFAEAFQRGWVAYRNALEDPLALSAIRLTLLVAVIAVPLNVLFGLTASWAIAKFDFAGKRLLITLIDLPFSVSPVISGVIYVLLFGSGSLLGDWLAEHDMPISNGDCCTACCCAMPALWANSARYRSSPAIFVGLPTPYRCMSKSSITSIISSQHSPWPRF